MSAERDTTTRKMGFTLSFKVEECTREQQFELRDALAGLIPDGGAGEVRIRFLD